MKSFLAKHHTIINYKIFSSEDDEISLVEKFYQEKSFF